MSETWPDAMSLSETLLREPNLILDQSLDLQSIARLSSCSKGFRAACEDARVWRKLLHDRWGVDADGNPHAALAWLEVEVREVMRLSFKRGFHMMLCDGRCGACATSSASPSAAPRGFARPLRPLDAPSPVAPAAEPSSEEEAPGAPHGGAPCGWEVPARRLLTWLPLHERRVLASFICHDSHPRHSLQRFLWQISLAGMPTPEHALRELLLHFPFLPIDAGSGADRVIGQFSWAWLRDNPESLCNIGMAGDEAPVERRHAVYSLTYATIMLNTDLHNAVVQPKIKPVEFVKNCRHVVPLRGVPEAILLAIHAAILARPLAIAPVRRVGTFVCGGGGPGAAPTYSMNAALGHDADVAAATAVALAAGAAGGGTRHPKLDWAVAYYNTLDMCQDARSWVRRATLAWRVALALLFVAIMVIPMLAMAPLSK